MSDMSVTDDRMLVAYVDGELGVMETVAVEAALTRDPALREKVRLLRDSALLLREAYAPMLAEKLPAELLALVEAADPDNVNSNVVPLWRFAAWRAQPGARLLFRLAASVILVCVGAAGGWMAAGQRTKDVGMDAALQAAATVLVQRTLENMVSGTSDVWRDPRSNATLSVTPVRTFKDGDDRYCREYRETVSRGSEHVFLRVGVACRDAEGRWQARFHVIPGSDPPEGLVSY